MQFLPVVAIVLLIAMLAGCIGGGEVGVDQAVVINVKSGGSIVGSSCETTVRMEDGSSRIFTTSACPEEGDHVCVSKSATPAIIDGCKWT